MVWYRGFEQIIFCHVLMQYDQKKLASLKVENQNVPLPPPPQCKKQG